jgi:tetratricopeptide (TPR) repeat protein
MTRLTVDQIRELLPEFEELRALADQLVATSKPDPALQWAGSGELGTAGARLVDIPSLRDALDTVLSRESTHLAQVYSLVTQALIHVAAQHHADAARCYLDLSAAEEGRDRPHHAAEYASTAFELARASDDATLQGLALRRRARSRREAGRLTDAERDYLRAHELAEAVRDIRGGAEAAIGAGNVLEEQGRWVAAEQWYRAALDMLAGLDGETPEKWQALLNLHVVMRSRGEVGASVGPIEAAEAVAMALNDHSATQFLQNARGQWLMAQGLFEAAVDRLRTAVAASTSARASVTIRLNLAEALLAAGRHLDAAEEARRAESEALRARLQPKLPEVYRLLGRIAVAEGNADSFVLFERALDLLAARDSPALERAVTLQAYADAERQLGNPQTADDLAAEADSIYLRLGIHQRRSEWADQFGTADDHGAKAQTQSEEGR